MKYTIFVNGVGDYGLFDSKDSAEELLKSKGWKEIPKEIRNREVKPNHYYLPSKRGDNYRYTCRIDLFYFPREIDQLDLLNT